MKLTKDEKAQAIQLAMDLELENFNRYVIQGLFKTFSKQERNALFKFWRKCCPLTQKAYLACCAHLKSLDKKDKIKDFFQWVLVGLAHIAGAIFLYVFLVLAFAWAGV